MAQKRMFDRAIIDTDRFMDLGMTAKAFYFLLGMEADDEGFVSYKKVMRIHGGNEDDMKVLTAKGFILHFPSGVVVITDWNTNNYLDKNRLKSTEYQKEKEMLLLTTNGKYEFNNRLTRGEERSIEESISEAKASRVPVFSIQPEEESNRVYRNSPDMLDYATSLWKPVNPAAHNWYTKNKTERLNIDRLITEEGMEWLEKVTKMLPKTNGLQYFPVITTASLLYKKRADFKAAIEKQISKETTKKTIII